MKRFLFSLIFLALFQFTTFAQYEFGTYYVDVNLNFKMANLKYDNSNFTYYKNNNLKITPEIGYFIDNRLALGIGLRYMNTFGSTANTTVSSYSNGTLDYKLSPAYSTELNEFDPTIFIKYFFQPTKKLSISLKASYSKGWGTYNLIQKYTKEPQGQETIFKSEKDKVESKYIYLSPELQYLITSKIGFQVNFNGLGYESTTNFDNYFDLNGFNPALSTSSITKYSTESTNFNINPSAWSFGLFVLLN